MTDSRSPLSALALVLLFLCLSAPIDSWAQQGLKEFGGPEEIVVTARKKEESLQDVPISITAFTAEALQESGAINNYDVALLTVNFNTLQQNGRRQDRPVIRGQAAPANRGEPNASYFIDGAYVSGSISTASLGPIERVEILRGPQSAQFGRATFAGAVNYVTRKPTNEWTGQMQANAGKYDKYLLSAWTSGPLIEDTLLFFGSVSWDKYGGGEFHNNLNEGAAMNADKFIDPNQSADYSRLNGTETKDILGKLLWQINDTAELTFKASYTNGSDQHYAQLILEQEEMNCYPNEFGTFLAYCGTMDMERIHTYDPSDPLNGQARQNRLNIPDLQTGMTSGTINLATPEDQSAFQSQGETVGANRDQYRLLLEYQQDFANWQMTVRGAHNNDDLAQAFDLDHKESRPFSGLFSFYQEQNVKDNSLEIRFDAPVDNRLRGSIGAYYFNSDWSSQQHSNVGVAQGQLSPAVKQETTNYAIFGALDYDLSDRWTFSAEARVARDEKSISADMYCLEDAGLAAGWTKPDGSPRPANQNWSPGFVKYIDPNTPISHEISTDSFTPRLTFRYQVTDESMVYWQAAKGNKPADFNSPYYGYNREGCQTQVGFYETGQGTVKEEKAWTYEIGTKTSWLDNRIVANVAFFYIDWENQGVFQVTPISLYVEPFINAGFLGFGYQSISDSIIENAGKSTVHGLEFESSYFINQNLQLNFSYGLSVGKYESYNDPFYAAVTGIDGNPETCADPTTCAEMYPNGNVAGHTIPDSPRHSLVLGANYIHTLNASLDWFLRSDLVYETARQIGAANFLQIDERTFWNARTGIQNDTWAVTAYVNNILDEKSAASVLRFVNFDVSENDSTNPPAAYAASPLPGINYGIEMLYRFGN